MVECYPRRTEFVALARRATLVPVYTELIADGDTPVSALAKLGADAGAFLLESVESDNTLGRYSFLGNSFFKTFRAHGAHVTITDAEGKVTKTKADDGLAALERLLAAYAPAPVSGLPRFFGGAVGYVGYDAGVIVSRSPASASTDDAPWPDIYVLLTDEVLIFDHVRRKMQIVVNTRPGDDPEGAYAAALRRINSIVKRLQGEAGLPPLMNAGRAAVRVGKKWTEPDERFTEAVGRVQREVHEGRVLQAFVSRSLSTPLPGRPLDVYRRLRTLSPSPYMFYINFGPLQLVGASPEMMVRLEDGVARLRPTSGARAEHKMLVDAARNDLGHVCRFGSVRVNELLTTRQDDGMTYIVGQLAPGKTAFDLLRATFPAGTVSGVPKGPAMRAIAEVEAGHRGPYGGAVGYFSFGGNMDTCIAVRTMAIRDGQAHIRAGTRVVKGADAQQNHAETVREAETLLQALALSREVAR